MRHVTYNEQEIHKHCEIRLILLGKYKYAHVHPIHPPFGTIPKPFPTKVKEEDTKPKIKLEDKPKHKRQKGRNIMSKVTCRGQKLATRSVNSNICSSNIIGDQTHVHNTRPTNNQPVKRTSLKPLCESYRIINYAMLNDGLEPDMSPSPKRKHRQKIRPKVDGPSATRMSAQVQSMINKQRNNSPESDSETPEASNKETELVDLKKIMDSFDAEEEKIIGTIVKLDCDGSQGISNSPPRITLNEDANHVHTTGLDGHEAATTGPNLPLEGVTDNQESNNDVPTVRNNEVVPLVTVNDIEPVTQNINFIVHPITPVTPESAALKEVTLLSPAPQSTEGVTTTTTYLDQLTPANPVLGVTQRTLSDQPSNVLVLVLLQEMTHKNCKSVEITRSSGQSN